MNILAFICREHNYINHANNCTTPYYEVHKKVKQYDVTMMTWNKCDHRLLLHSLKSQKSLSTIETPYDAADIGTKRNAQSRLVDNWRIYRQLAHNALILILNQNCIEVKDQI